MFYLCHESVRMAKLAVEVVLPALTTQGLLHKHIKMNRHISIK